MSDSLDITPAALLAFLDAPMQPRLFGGALWRTLAGRWALALLCAIGAFLLCLGCAGFAMHFAMFSTNYRTEAAVAAAYFAWATFVTLRFLCDVVQRVLAMARSQYILDFLESLPRQQPRRSARLRGVQRVYRR